MFVDLDTTFTAFADVARPFIQETISETPPTLEAGERDLPDPPVPGNSAGLFTEPAARASRRSPRARRRSPTALEVGAPVLADSPNLNRAARPDRGVARCASTTTPTSAPASPPATDDRHLRPDAQRSSRRRRRSATTRRSSSATWRASSRRAAPAAAGSGSPSSTRPTGPNNEGQPASGAGQRRRPRQPQLPALQPVSEHRGAGPDRRVRGRQRGPYAGRPAGIGNVPGQPGHDHRDQLRRPGSRTRRRRDGALLAAISAPAPRDRRVGADDARLGPPLPRAVALGLRPDHPDRDRRSCRLPRLHEEAAVHRRRATSSPPSSRTRPPCARPRRCGSPASTSAR